MSASGTAISLENVLLPQTTVAGPQLSAGERSSRSIGAFPIRTRSGPDQDHAPTRCPGSDDTSS
ncbi:hypothetical protein BKH13_01905 [Actinomyces naeslundii]|uniref:Uncharacterized protein n=1 Tax=Actinomyces naeslundii TaxID=1655 RepID=A0ABX3F1N9_ACTNA|nr:hypothetical protein BKH12_12125 [Actinomyces naeslundii]OLO85726.1 hypothetical protein BKH13_01905 [Actinomyces naeslundii]OLO92124.1 hypothetical protein BKH10_01570 [Actinomyces naeslundii]